LFPCQIRSSDSEAKSDGIKLVGPAPFDDDPVAITECDSIDYSIKVSASKGSY
jgi:hypothetical protein